MRLGSCSTTRPNWRGSSRPSTPRARSADAYVRVTDGSLAAIRAALSEEGEGYHVLHISCHARPGELILETHDAQPDPVDARRLLAEGLPAGVDLPMVVLSGCSTGLQARATPLTGGQNGDEQEGEAALGGIAQQLLAAGVPIVIAMQAPVSDSYATAQAPRRGRAEWATPTL